MGPAAAGCAVHTRSFLARSLTAEHGSCDASASG